MIAAPLMQTRVRARAWLTTNNRDWWLFVAACVIGIPLDIWLVNTGRESITSMVTEQCQRHDTLIALGMMVGLGVARAVKRYWWQVALTLVTTGHCFTGLVVP